VNERDVKGRRKGEKHKKSGQTLSLRETESQATGAMYDIWQSGPFPATKKKKKRRTRPKAQKTKGQR